jgi:hypothetical protein
MVPPLLPIITYIQFEDFTSVTLKIIFWDGMLCSLRGVHQCFGERYILCFQGQRGSHVSNQQDVDRQIEE